MSSSSLLVPGSNKINGAYLPTGPAPTHPYIENPFQDDVDGGTYNLTNVYKVGVNQIVDADNGWVGVSVPLSISLPTAGGLPDNVPNDNTLFQVSGPTILQVSNGGPGGNPRAPVAGETLHVYDGDVVVSGNIKRDGGSGVGQVYDSVYNPPPAPIIPNAGVNLANLLTVAVPQKVNTFALPSSGTWLVIGSVTLQGVVTDATGTLDVIASGTTSTTLPLVSYNGTLTIPFTTFIVGNQLSLDVSIGGLTAIGGAGEQFIWWSYQKMA
jgi:hypothetical protein